MLNSVAGTSYKSDYRAFSVRVDDGEMRSGSPVDVRTSDPLVTTDRGTPAFSATTFETGMRPNWSAEPSATIRTLAEIRHIMLRGGARDAHVHNSSPMDWSVIGDN